MVGPERTDNDLVPRVLHIANWYPNPWNEMEGNYIRDHIQLFDEVSDGRTVVVQVRSDARLVPRLKMLQLERGASGYFLFTSLPVGKITEWLANLLLLFALLRIRAWRFDVLHFHVAYPLLVHAGLWRWFLRKPILISEHWSAYHFNFYLPEEAKALRILRRPFRHCFSVLAVSEALLSDIRRFTGDQGLRGHVIPNVVPLHGARETRNTVPLLFSVNRWVPIKDPMPMLEGLALAADAGIEFELRLGGFGELTEQMQDFVAQSSLAGRANFLGKMTKAQIAQQLASCDGYLFASHYETFSVACAEALGAGIPLVGPFVPAIAEYAGPDDWETVATRDAEGWKQAIMRYVTRWRDGGFDKAAVAERAAHRFAADRLRKAYRQVVDQALLGNVSS